ncbi:MAG TPA: glycosyltransferase, partial [Flavobacteriaceae bacterium]|nr:glycosyltransferase [Flavobacteriaceae bacterium]
MLSILIPTYNYYIYDLVLNIHEKCLKENIDFEIICLDDHSDTNFTEANKKIEKLSNCYYKISSKNKGRVATREHLAELAKYKWLLFLDADVLPKNYNFIKKYINYLGLEYAAIFGGFYYDENSKNKHLLRWKYGKKNEQVPAKQRNLKPYKVVISANLLIKKDTYLPISKQLKTNTYGGDLIFAALLKEQHIKILHIDNEVVHLGLENNKSFL